MRILNDIGMVLGDTSRSRVYLQALAAHGFVVAHAFLLPAGEKGRPGQLCDLQAQTHDTHEAPWGTVDLTLGVQGLLRTQAAACTVLPSGDINHPDVVDILAQAAQPVMIYSGFGGVILRQAVLGCGKRFLHVHGGYLPDYKGSTTNYYSYLADGCCGASSIFMSDRIDSGPVLVRQRFLPQGSLRQVDHVLDACYRAQVLCSTLQLYLEHGSWPDAGCRGEGRVYYIMHPVLRHIAVCSSMKENHA
jgi:methionyl-tRNA formyltransferase